MVLIQRKTSIHKLVQKIFSGNPTGIFTTIDLQTTLKKGYGVHIKKEIITTILTRLHRKGLILRTPVQLTKGYYYSLENKSGLVELYKKYILPFDIDNKEGLISQLVTTQFPCAYADTSLDVDKLKQFDFVKKYGSSLFLMPETQQFLALLVGFSMGDGNIDKKCNSSRFFFRRERDAKRFAEDFTKHFPLDKFNISHSKYGDSYVVRILRSSTFARFLHYLGAPKGNKVLQPFDVPVWIYNGQNEIKKSFLSAMLGCEGSAPSKNRWRIQFVLSKSKKHIPNLISFLNQLRQVLYESGIETSYIQLRKQEGRHFNARFYIKGKENLNKFYKQLEFSYASEKQEVLKELINRTAAEVECAMI